MKKLPTLFERVFENHKVVECLPAFSKPEGALWLQEGVPTLKIDGACCMIGEGGRLYKRYDAKNGKQPPAGAIPCEPAPDPVTGHWPHWVEVSPNAPEDKWFIEAYRQATERHIDIYGRHLPAGTYEAIGPHFQGNPYQREYDTLVRHGSVIIEDLPERSYAGIKAYLQTHMIEGIVFWYFGEPVCKVKRKDFGLKWPK